MIDKDECGAAKVANLSRSQQECGSPRLAINIFGGLAVTLDGVPIALPNRKAGAALAFLAVEPVFSVSRERLAGLLWGDVQDQRALASLRTALFELRASIGPASQTVLVVRRKDVLLMHDHVQVDIHVAATQLQAGVIPAALEHPLACESILAGFDDAGQGWADWVRALRQRTFERLRDMMQFAFEDPKRSAPAKRMMAAACLRLDPLHEPACREIMRLCAEAGDIGGALKSYADLYERLDSEFDMEPSSATQHLVADIKRGLIGPSAAASSLSVGCVSPPAAAVSSPIARSGVPRIAVLPFRGLAAESVPPCFREGIVDDVVRTLACLREPEVVSSNSTRHLRGDEIDHAAVAQQLGVQYLVSGTARMIEGGARIAVELSEAQGGVVLWSANYDVAADRLFDTQDELAARIAHTFAPRVSAAELRASRRRHPEDLDAYQLVLRARDAMFSLERASFNEAAAMLRRAAVLDPGFAATFAAIASWHSLRLFQGWSEDPVADTGFLVTNARIALRLEPGDGRMMALLGHVSTTTARQYVEALEMFDSAIDLTPNDPEVMMLSSATCAYVGQGEAAVRRAQQAIALSPHDPFLYRLEHFCSLAHFAAGDFEQAVGWGRRSMRRNPNYVANLRVTAASAAGLGLMAEASEIGRAVLGLEPTFRVQKFSERHPFRDPASRGRFGELLLAAGLPP